MMLLWALICIEWLSVKIIFIALVLFFGGRNLYIDDGQLIDTRYSIITAACFSLFILISLF